MLHQSSTIIIGAVADARLHGHDAVGTSSDCVLSNALHLLLMPHHGMCSCCGTINGT
jgi:hypothetical protein